jgi:hypothetical protein
MFRADDIAKGQNDNKERGKYSFVQFVAILKYLNASTSTKYMRSDDWLVSLSFRLSTKHRTCIKSKELKILLSNSPFD